jgi:hypothetical protein
MMTRRSSAILLAARLLAPGVLAMAPCAHAGPQTVPLNAPALASGIYLQSTVATPVTVRILAANGAPCGADIRMTPGGRIAVGTCGPTASAAINSGGQVTATPVRAGVVYEIYAAAANRWSLRPVTNAN